MAKRAFGWHKSPPDDRDWIHRPSGLVVPPKFTLAKWLCNVRDQGNEGSCTGFGLGGQCTSVAKKIPLHPKEWYSPRDIYNGERTLMGTLQDDSGADPRTGYKWISTRGLILDHFWPYVDQPLDVRQRNPKLNDQANLTLPITYTRVTGGIPAIIDALAAGNFLSIGSPWYENWMNPGSNGVLPHVGKSAVAGGHETFWYGYDQTANYLLGQNSWSPAWGNAGRYLMPFSAITNFLADGGYDVYYITVKWLPVAQQGAQS